MVMATMIEELSVTHQALLSVAIVLVSYIVAIAIGRSLKRHLRLRLELGYKLLCAAFSIYLALVIVYPGATGLVYEFQRGSLAAAVVLSTFFFVALLRRFLWEAYFEARRKIEVPNFIREVLGLLLFIIAVIIVMDVIYNLPITGVVAGSGIAAIIIGFAMQDLLGNIIAGVSLEIGRPFKVGDWLKIEDEYARVTEIHWRSVRLITNDDITLDIPNNKIVQHTIRNLQYPNQQYAVRLTVGVDYNAPPNRVKDICVRAAMNASGVLKSPAPKAFLIDFGESAIQYQVKFYIDTHRYYSDTMDAVRSNLWYELRRAGITIPFPIRTVHIERPGRQPAGSRATAVQALQNQSLFQALSEEQLNQVVAEAHPESFGRHEHIIDQGAPGETMFVIVDGVAEVYVAPQGGEPAHVATLRAGDCFGEMSLLSGQNRSATIIASTDCEVLEINKVNFARLVHEYPEILEGLSGLLATRKVENEGILASASKNETAAVEEVHAGILTKFYSYFGL